MSPVLRIRLELVPTDPTPPCAAHRYYGRLGFTASREGFKLRLD